MATRGGTGGTVRRGKAAPRATKTVPAVLPEPAPRRVLVSSLRNEGPFLLEWVAYHRAIGFDEIVIAHNDCTDGSAELLEALAGIGWVTPVENVVPEGLAPQQAAAQALAGSGRLAAGDWAIWLDLDEFLNIHVGDRTLGALIAAIGPAKALLIPWRIFGDSGVEEFPGRFLHPAFHLAAGPERDQNRALKTLFRHGPWISRLDIHRPHLVEGNGWHRAEVLTAAGQPMDQRYGPHMRWLSGENPRSFARMGGHDTGWDLAQINHYAVRTERLYALKRLRGRGYWQEAQTTTKLRHSAAFFAAQNLNDVEDASILHWQDRVGALMAEAEAVPAVAAAQRLVAARLAENLAGIDRAAEETGSMTEGATQPAETKTVPGPADFAPTMWFPDEVKAFVQERYRGAQQILEYGSGGSTAFAAGETQARVVSIESDRKWAAALVAHLETAGIARPGVSVLWADIGPTRAWGKPKDTRLWGQFCQYPLLPWTAPELGDFSPDLVLIDGRFRLGCLAATLLHCRRPTTVLIDDYAKRKPYHAAEALVPLAGRVGHMARFEIGPRSYSNAEFAAMLPWFFSVD